MKNALILFGLYLIIGSCCSGPIYVSFVNETSTPVKVTYSTKNMNYNHSIYYDTISYCQLYLKATYNNGKKRLSKYIHFFKFETPTKCVCVEGPDEVKKYSTRMVNLMIRINSSSQTVCLIISNGNLYHKSVMS